MIQTSMTPAEVTSTREMYGLTQDSFAEWLGVNRNTVLRWERGLTAVGAGIPVEFSKLEQITALNVQLILAALEAAPDAWVVTYEKLSDFQANNPGAALTDRWHRAVIARVQLERPETRALYWGQDDDELTILQVPVSMPDWANHG